MTRYEKTFADLEAKGEGAFVPFVVAGDPGLEDSLAIIQTLVDSGADALELGFPFSDPLADGPVIQDAMGRALQANVTPADCLDLIGRFRESKGGIYQRIPIGLLVYANLVHSYGLEKFYRDCNSAGVDSVLVADVPVNESQPFCQAALKNDVDPIMVCPPNVDDVTLQKIASAGRGYTYLLSRAGVTGSEVAASMPVEHLLEKLCAHNAAPALLGFGISRPEHVRMAIKSGAKGVIVGSAIVQIIQKNVELNKPYDSERLYGELSEYLAELKSATCYS